MFGQLKAVVEAVCTGFKTVREFKSKSDREKSILDMLMFYFLLKDCVDDGERLILEAGSRPVAKIRAMSLQEADAVITRWDRALGLQGSRLYKLAGLLFTEHALAVMNPALEKQLNEIIGSKFNSAVTLHGITSALVFGPSPEVSNADKAQYVPCMAGERSRMRINMSRVCREISELRPALEGYRSHIEKIATSAEIAALSAKARELTRPKGEPSPSNPP